VREVARVRLALAALALACSTPALAHGAFGSSKPLVSGALHLLTSPLSLVALAGAIAALCGLQGRWLVVASAVVAVGVAAGCIWGGRLPLYTPSAAIVVVGLLAVSGIRISNGLALPIALLAGLSAGIAASLDEVITPAVIGASLPAFVITAYALASYADFSHLPKVQSIGPIARRVLGAWVAAIGLLLFALELRGGVATS
jgi:hypothetical protein